MKKWNKKQTKTKENDYGSNGIANSWAMRRNDKDEIKRREWEL